MNRQSPIDEQTTEQTGRVARIGRVAACPLARAADGPLGALVLLVLLLIAVALVVQMWRRARLPCCAPQWCSWVDGEVWEEMRRRGRSNGCEWAPRAGRAAGSGQQRWVVSFGCVGDGCGTWEGIWVGEEVK